MIVYLLVRACWHLVVAQGGVLSLVPGCSATVSTNNGQVSGTLAARSFPSAGSPVGPTLDLYTASAPADSIGYVPAAAGTPLAYPAGIAVTDCRFLITSFAERVALCSSFMAGTHSR